MAKTVFGWAIDWEMVKGNAREFVVYYHMWFRLWFNPLIVYYL